MNTHSITTIAAKAGLVLGLLAAGLAVQPAFAADGMTPLSGAGLPLVQEPFPALPAMDTQPKVGTYEPKRANFAQAQPSREARHVADWAVDSGDNGGMPFVIVDKADARVFVFDAGGQLRGASSALLGLARGDDSVPGIGQRKLSSILPEERTTPAGRFVAALDHNLQGKEMLWVDYETAISLHPVVTSNARERRAERLVTPSPLDNRISYGCINVPADFYASVVSPAFTGTDGIVYVLPETRSAHAVFGAYDVEERARLNMASQAVSAPVVSRSAANLAR